MDPRVPPEEAAEAVTRPPGKRVIAMKMVLDRRTLEAIQLEARRVASRFGIPVTSITVAPARTGVKRSRAAPPR
jgi:hypothetical protein